MHIRVSSGDRDKCRKIEKILNYSYFLFTYYLIYTKFLACGSYDFFDTTRAVRVACERMTVGGQAGSLRLERRWAGGCTASSENTVGRTNGRRACGRTVVKNSCLALDNKGSEFTAGAIWDNCW